MHNLSLIENAYIEAMFWTSTGPEFEPEDLGEADVTELAPETLAQIAEDCAAFEATADATGLLEGLDDGQTGHDLWLTRNGHGVGFWDRDLGDVGDQLTAIAKAMGEVALYRGDDGLLYLS